MWAWPSLVIIVFDIYWAGLWFLATFLIPSCTLLWCVAKFPFWENFLPHCPQGYLTHSCTPLWCSTRLLLVVARYSQLLQEYLTPSCTPLWCSARLLLVVAWYSHMLQEYLTHVLPFGVDPDFLFLKTVCHIVRRSIWLLYVLSCGAQSDLSS